MIAAYGSVLILLVVAALIGQALISISLGVRSGRGIPFSWLAPVVGIAAMLLIGGTTARLPGHGVTAAVFIGLFALLAAWWLQGRVIAIGETLKLRRAGDPDLARRRLDPVRDRRSRRASSAPG